MKEEGGIKHLWLVRHAKSSWKFPVSDFDRPLNKRGKRDAPGMGVYLLEHGIVPQVIMSSPARRARETAGLLAAVMRIPAADIVEDERIYDATPEALIAVVRGWNERWERVAMVGHNPGIADMVGLLTDAAVGHVPTCAVLELALEVARWCDVTPGCGALRLKMTPKTIHNP